MRVPLPPYRSRLFRTLPGARLIRLLCLAVVLCLPDPAGADPAAAPTAPPLPAPAADPAKPARPALTTPAGGLDLAPFLFSLSDPAGTLTINDVTAGGDGPAFRPFTPTLTDRPAGVVWLRFTMDPAAALPPDGGGRSLLDLGDQTPGTPRVWTRPEGKGEPREVSRDETGLYPLDSLARGGEAYVRLDGLPGLWFSPSIRTLPEALADPERRVHPLALAGLTALLLLCVVRSVTERGEGRIWAAVFAAAALLHAFSGVPAAPSGVVPAGDMPGLLAAGIALMLLPHVGRNIMRTRENAPALDVFLLILALPGAALALLPLLPGQAWTARLLALWPLGAALTLLPSLLLLLRGAPGSGLFCLACAGMAGGSLAALWGMGGPDAPLWGQGPLLGVTFAVLLLAAAPRSTYAEAAADEPGRGDAPPPIRRQEAPLSENGGATARGDGWSPRMSARLEEALRPPLDLLLREAYALDQALAPETLARQLSARPGAPLPEAIRNARRHADNLTAASRSLSALVTDIPRAAAQADRRPSAREAFDLRLLVRDAFDAVRGEAEKKGLALSWYIAPHLGLLYRGDRDRLRRMLGLLLEDAVRATDRGSVSLRVRRGEKSVNPGHLQFSVVDTGQGTPPLRRGSLVLARVWELAADHRGTLRVDGAPEGMEISFSLDCVSLAEDGTGDLSRSFGAAAAPRSDRLLPAEPRPDLVIVASDVPLNRQLLAFYLRDQGQEIREARDAGEAADLYARAPAGAVVFDGHLPEEDIITAIAAIRAFEGEYTLPASPFLCVTPDEAQAERLRLAGCDHALPFPVRRDEFRATVLRLSRQDAPPSRSAPRRPSEGPRPSAPARGEDSGPSLLPEAPAGSRPDPAANRPKNTQPGLSRPETDAVTDAAEGTAKSSPAAGKTSGPVREKDGNQTAVPSGLNLPPAPRTLLSRIVFLFKPTPRVRQEAPDPEISLPGGEWVGEPTPIRRPSADDFGSIPAKPAADPAADLTPESPVPPSEPPLAGDPGGEDSPAPENVAEEESCPDASPSDPGDPVLPLPEDPAPSVSDGSAENATAPERRTEDRAPHKRNRLEDLPFLTLDPNDGPGLSAGEEDIVELTEAEMLDSPLLRHAPALAGDLEAALERAEAALKEADADAIAEAARDMADNAAAFGLHGLSDLALCMKEAALAGDFEAVTQLLPDLRAETIRQRRA